jgi:hypothetical protein
VSNELPLHEERTPSFVFPWDAAGKRSEHPIYQPPYSEDPYYPDPYQCR